MFLATHGILRSINGGVPFEDTHSFEYDGVSDYLDCGDNNNLSFGNGVNDSAFSISVWVKMVDATKFRILQKYGSSGVEYLLGTGGTDTLVFNLYDNSAGARIGRQYSTPMTSFENQWVHIVGVYTGGGSPSFIRIFVNGVRVDDTNSTLGSYVAMENTSEPLTIGKLTTTYANGKIDEPVIFNYELTNSQVNQIYNSGIPDSISSLNPLSHWRAENATFDGSNWSITDAGSGGNNATSVSMTSSSRSTDVPFNYRSIVLDGINDHINLSAPLNLRFNRSDSFSFSAWVKREGTNNKTILSNQLAPSTNYRGYYFAIDNNAKLNVVFRSTLSDRLVFRGTLSVDLGWNHVVFTYDGTASTNSGQFYINGSADTTTGSGTLTGTAESTDTLYMGCRSNADNFFDGKLDEVSVFNSELSQSDVTSIYNNGVPNNISSLNPLSWWRFEGTGTTATDSGSGGNNGTLVNGVTRGTDVP